MSFCLLQGGHFDLTGYGENGSVLLFGSVSRCNLVAGTSVALPSVVGVVDLEGGMGTRLVGWDGVVGVWRVDSLGGCLGGCGCTERA